VSDPWDLLPRRQSWGVYSVRAHLNLAALAAEVLYYDRLVLPSPENELEAERFDSQGWDTQRLGEIVGHLGALVHVVPWDEKMRAEWKIHHEWLKGVGRNTEDAAYGATPLTMVPRIWDDVRRHQPAGDLPPVTPRVVAAYLEAGEALADYAFTVAPGAAAAAGGGAANRQSAAIVRRKVKIMDGEDAEDCFLRAVRLAREPDYQAARARLFAYEDGLIADEVPAAEVCAALDDAHAKFNAAIDSYDSKTKWHYVSRLVSIGGGRGVSALTGAPVGGAATYAIQKGLAQFPAFDRGRDPRAAHPGQALELVSAAFSDDPG
jgi:hypothetical protein